jgi:hypothetical protein
MGDKAPASSCGDQTVQAQVDVRGWCDEGDAVVGDFPVQSGEPVLGLRGIH